MIISILKNIAKILLMAKGYDIVFVQASAMLVGLIQMAYITWYIKTKYKWIDLRVKPDYGAISQSKNVLVHQLSGLIFNNTDTIILTIVCGLKTVSIYSMYTLLFGMISIALNTVSSSVMFMLGQSYHANKERFIKLLDVFEVYYMALVFALYSVANFFILPFMKLYTSGVADIDYIDSKLPLLFIATYLLSCGRKSSNTIINIAGHFRLTQNRAIFEAAINLVVSLVAVHFLGIYGVLLGTIAALLYRTNDMIWYASKKILQRNPWIVYRRWLIDLGVFVMILEINKMLHLLLDSYLKIFTLCVPYTIVVLVLFGMISSLFERDAAKTLLNLIKHESFGKIM